MPRNNNNNRGGNRGGRRSKNNNPEGYNQYNSGWMDAARERPVAAAAAAAAAVGAGVFLWSKRGQISEQLSQISDQIGEWSETLSSERELELAGGGTEFSGSTSSRTSGDFGGTSFAGRTTRKATPRSSPSTTSKRRSATTGVSSGSGTMSGGSLDTGPSGRGRE
jgi:hypothetical protein